MLRYSADIRTLVYMAVTTAVFVLQWTVVGFSWPLYVFYLFLSIAVTVIAHNHNHLPIWRNKTLNTLTDYWLTVFYGFPAFAWIPTHNMNHHALNNREGDYTITYRLTEHNHLLMLLFYPTMSSYYQQKPIRDYLKNLWATDRRKFWLSAMQYVALAVWIVGFAIIDWQKCLLYVVIPQQIGLFAVLVFNYVQHVHADEESKYDHSRNFTGWLNLLLFNNGYHTVHHDKAGTHWSKTPELHAKIADKIDPSLNEKSFWWYIFRVYFLAPFAPSLKTRSKRLERLRTEQTLDTPRDLAA
ncbi:MAG TPA: fatty acid desaturase [Bacteroidetes bacterium]|nr:fatty acid desaturase [Bacteroidota bacterium]